MNILRKIWRALADNLAYYFAPCAAVAIGVASGCEDGGNRAPLGLASCWDAGGGRRMMNVLSPRMPDAVFRERLAWMRSRGCDTAHILLANGGDGEYAGYAAWRDADRPVMLARLRAVRDAGLAPVPWIVSDDSDGLREELFARPRAILPALAEFFEGAPYVVIGLEMDEGRGCSADWSAVRAALRDVYAGPVGVHHRNGSVFHYAGFGDIVLGQLAPGCSEAQVRAQIIAILQLGKRAVGFEYARGPARALALAALDAGAEGVGNW